MVKESFYYGYRYKLFPIGAFLAKVCYNHIIVSFMHNDVPAIQNMQLVRKTRLSS